MANHTECTVTIKLDVSGNHIGEDSVLSSSEITYSGDESEKKNAVREAEMLCREHVARMGFNID